MEQYKHNSASSNLKIRLDAFSAPYKFMQDEMDANKLYDVFHEVSHGRNRLILNNGNKAPSCEKKDSD